MSETAVRAVAINAPAMPGRVLASGLQLRVWWSDFAARTGSGPKPWREQFVDRQLCRLDLGDPVSRWTFASWVLEHYIDGRTVQLGRAAVLHRWLRRDYVPDEGEIVDVLEWWREVSGG